MPVFNKMVYNGTEYILGGGGNIGEPLNLTVTTSGLDATITWEDNEIGTIPPTTFQKSELVRKIGSAPTSPSDGVLVVTETVKDTYKTTGYVDQGLTDGETYYYRVFSYSDLGGISYCDAVSVTPSAGGWQPGANTVAYYPLTSTSTSSDLSGNGHTLTTFTGITFNTLASGKSVAQFNGSSSGSSCFAYTDEFTMGNIGTLSIWAKPENNGGSYANKYILFRKGYQTDDQQARINLYTAWVGYYTAEHSGGDSQNYQSSISPIVDGSWHHFVVTSTTNNVSLYIDGILIGSNTNSITERTDAGRIYVASNNDGYYGYKGGISEAIVEDKVRTAQEVSDYYDQTKGDYGIS